MDASSKARSSATSRSTVHVFAWGALALGVLAVLAFGLYQAGVWPSGLFFGDAGGRFSADRSSTDDAALSEDLQRAWALLGGGAGTLVGELEADDERLTEAERLIEGAAESMPNSPDVHRLRGVLLLARGDYAAAQTSLERSLELQPRHHQTLLTLGATHVQAGDFESGERVFRQALEKRPDSVEALHNLGQTLWLLGREDEALEVYRRKIAIMDRAEQQLAAERSGTGG